MRHRKVLPVMLAVLFSIQTSSAKKLTWQTGKLTRIESRTAGTVALPVGGMLVATQIRDWVYVVETDTMIYQFERRSRAPLNVTVNANIEFAVDRSGKAFLENDAGKKFRVVILRKTATKKKP